MDLSLILNYKKYIDYIFARHSVKVIDLKKCFSKKAANNFKNIKNNSKIIQKYQK